MSQVLVSPAQLSAYASAQGAVSAHAQSTADAQRTPVTVLAPTFGIIGADFLAALGAVCDDRARRVEQIAAGHARLSSGTVDAASTYTGTDRQLSLP